MNKVFTDNGWKDCVYCLTKDRKTLKKILTISQETERKELENRSRWLEICLVIGAGESMTKNV